MIGLFAAALAVVATIPLAARNLLKMDEHSELMRARGEAKKWADCMRVWGMIGNRERFERCADKFDQAAAKVAELEGRVETTKKWSEP